MTIAEELVKLKGAKTHIRKAIQQNKSQMTTDTSMDSYSTEIDEFDNTLNVDLTNVKEYNTNSETQFITDADILRDYAFCNDTSLKELVLTSTQVVTLGINVFKNTLFESGTGIIYVPDDLLSTYQNSEDWNQYTLKASSEFVENMDTLYPLETVDKHLTVGAVSGLTLNEIEKF